MTLLLLPTAAFADQNLHLDLDSTYTSAKTQGTNIALYNNDGTLYISPFTTKYLNKITAFGTAGWQNTSTAPTPYIGSSYSNYMTWDAGLRYHLSPAIYVQGDYGTQLNDYAAITTGIPPGRGFQLNLHVHAF